MHLQFVESESTFDYFAATRAYLEIANHKVAYGLRGSIHPKSQIDLTYFIPELAPL
jgi:hypothetical protein